MYIDGTLLAEREIYRSQAHDALAKLAKKMDYPGGESMWKRICESWTIKEFIFLTRLFFREFDNQKDFMSLLGLIAKSSIAANAVRPAGIILNQLGYTSASFIQYQNVFEQAAHLGVYDLGIILEKIIKHTPDLPTILKPLHKILEAYSVANPNSVIYLSNKDWPEEWGPEGKARLIKAGLLKIGSRQAYVQNSGSVRRRLRIGSAKQTRPQIRLRTPKIQGRKNEGGTGGFN